MPKRTQKEEAARPMPTDEHGDELEFEDEFEERLINQRIMKRKENRQGLGPKNT